MPGELVLTYGDARGTGWVSNLLLGLRRVGIEHTLAVRAFLIGQVFITALAARRSAFHIWQVLTAAPACRALGSAPQKFSCAHTTWEARRLSQMSPKIIVRVAQGSTHTNGFATYRRY